MPLGNTDAASVSIKAATTKVVGLNMGFCSSKYEVFLLRRSDQPNSTLTNFQFKRIDIRNDIEQMKALEVCHQLGVSRVGKEQHHADRLHEISMREDHDAASRRKLSACEPANGFPRTIEKKSERLGLGAISECRILALPVGDHMGFTIQLTCFPMQRGIEETELLNGPFLDRNVREPSSQWLSSL